MRAKPLAERPLAVPAISRLPIDTQGRAEMLAAHAAAMERGDAGYIDPGSGLFVMTALSLANRGTCCERGCRHCPYEL